MPVYSLGPDATPDIHPDAWLHPEAVIIGRVVMGPESSAWPGAVIRADDNLISIGARTSIQDGAVLHCTDELATMIGDDCTVGHNAHLEGCILEDASLVGSGSVVLHGAVISSGALVGANALVAGGKVVPPNALALGIPAQIREHANTVEANIANATNYVERVRRYRGDLRRLD